MGRRSLRLLAHRERSRIDRMNTKSPFIPLTHLWQRLINNRRFISLIPFGWLSLFFLVPFGIIIKISFSESRLAIPPFHPLWEWLKNEQIHILVDFWSYVRIFSDPFYGAALLHSLIAAALATSICLVFGYAIAYAISRTPSHWRTPLILLIILPFWTSYLIRVYAWIGLLSPKGVINQVLLTLGWIQAPLPLIYNTFSVMVGLVYCYLPFMIFPIYATLLKIDPAYCEAASDLGATPWRIFRSITLPLSRPGIMAGCLLVFLPSVGEYIIPELLGGSDSMMLGRVLWMEFFNNRDWPLACALAVIMVIMFVIPVVLIQRAQLKASLESWK